MSNNGWIVGLSVRVKGGTIVLRLTQVCTSYLRVHPLGEDVEAFYRTRFVSTRGEEETVTDQSPIRNLVKPVTAPLEAPFKQEIIDLFLIRRSGPEEKRRNLQQYTSVLPRDQWDLFLLLKDLRWFLDTGEACWMEVYKIRSFISLDLYNVVFHRETLGWCTGS